MVQIDFIAGHPLQAQAAQAVYEALKDRAQCHWHIGRPLKPTGALAAVLVDHIHHHPDFTGWKKRFYMLHDLGDIDVYEKERQVLRRCTAVIVPDELHAAAARRHVSRRWWRAGTTVFLGGWPKYDGPGLAASDRELATTLEALPDRPTILYAVSWARENEWKALLLALKQLPVNVIIKNHPYATAPGEEVSAHYQYSRTSALAMEALARELHYVVASPDLNICLLFPYVDAVISDQSSALAEFLPWGASFETGANPKGSARPEMSRWYPEVIFRPLDRLLADLHEGGQQLLGEVVRAGHKSGAPRGAGPAIANMIWQEVCG